MHGLIDEAGLPTFQGHTRERERECWPELLLHLELQPYCGICLGPLQTGHRP